MVIMLPLNKAGKYQVLVVEGTKNAGKVKGRFLMGRAFLQAFPHLARWVGRRLADYGPRGGNQSQAIIIWDEDQVVIDGDTRLMTAQKAGI